MPQDILYETYQHYGTNAERLAFTPNPPTVTGVQPLYQWRETDTGLTYVYDTSWHLQNSAPGGSDQEIQYNNAGSFDGIPSVAAGYVLTDNGVGVAPSFQPSAGGGGSLLNEFLLMGG